MSTEQIRTPVNIEDEMKRSYLDYAMSVIIGRALPDVRDGLKPAHRRVLYAMSQMGLASNRAYRKCAKVIGEVIGNYHPHGDQPAYDTLVRLAQDFNMRKTLVDGQGNFGSVDGDPPAAYRYTEARLEALAESLMEDLDKNTVDFVPNFDETTTEPTVFPATYPNLLVNGSTGIAVGMATNIPPHNLGEVIDGVIWIIENTLMSSAATYTRDQKLKELIKLIPGPDFPTGGMIVGKRGIHEAYVTGRGSIQVRARTERRQPFVAYRGLSPARTQSTCCGKPHREMRTDRRARSDISRADCARRRPRRRSPCSCSRSSSRTTRDRCPGDGRCRGP